MKSYIITILNFFGAFWSIFKEVKKIIYHKGFISLKKKILKKRNSLEYPLELGLGGSKARFSLLQVQWW